MKTFCVLPWYSTELPSNTPCCWLANDADISQVKSDLLTGIKSPSCAKCWQIEEQGKASRRQIENQFLDYKLDRDLDKIKQDCVDNKSETLLYQITTSNLCNQACISCSSSASTKWAEIDRKMGLTPATYTITTLKDFNINYSTARRISLLGGEPLFDVTTFKMLETLIEHGNTDCFISIVTNGSITLNDAQIKLLKQFTDLNICLSIDGVGPVFEYLRWPGVWGELLSNISQYKSITKNISVSYTISAINAFYYDETIAWFFNNNLQYNHNIVTYPSWLALSNTPTVLRNNNFVKGVCSADVSADSMIAQLAKQDHAKKISIKNYLPEVAQLLGIP